MEEFIGNFIAFLIIGIPMAFAYWHLIYNSRQSKNDDIAKKIQKYISFDEGTRTLIVHELHPLIHRVVTMDRYEILHTAYQPETYTYTSVSVGNVTIGDVSKNDAYKYISGSSKTDKYELRYRWKSITKIKLCSKELIEKAKRAGLEKYMNNAGEIIVVGRARVSQDALKSALSGYYAQMQIEGLDAQPSYDKCKRILDFLTSTKGQPVPKEKKDPAQVAALKKTLVGLLVFFLVMGAIFVSLIPAMIEDEILRGLSGTYMDLNPTYCNGQTYTLKFKRERGEEQTLIVNGSEYDVYVKKPTWSKVEISGWSLSRLPFSSPLTLQYKWVDKEAVAIKLLDSEGNILWSMLAEDRYNAAIEMMEAGQYYEAVRVFETMIAYQDSAQMLEICQQEIMAIEVSGLDEEYADAVALMESGQYEEAISIFEGLGDFKDSAERVDEVKYAAAESLLAEGKTAEAAMAFAKIVGYNDARERSNALWAEIAVRETISATVDHTVGLRSDGTVVAEGKHWCGVYDVGNWTDIVAVSAGGDHTVGLRSDGTVLAVGDNDNGECNVNGWTDVVAVSAGDKAQVIADNVKLLALCD